MADSNTDDLEPLFDYRRVQPIDFVRIDDDSSDTSPVPSPKRRKIPDPDVVKIDDEDEDEVEVIEEEDWLAPPPMVSSNAYSNIGEDSTIKELRLMKQKLVSFAESSKTLSLEEESVKRKVSASLKSSLDAAVEQPKDPSSERAKIVVSVQKEDECKHFRIYMDDKFERLFNMYADKTKLDLQSLVFSFDGDKISPADTPASLEMEDDDLIEVHVKKR
ncbi:Small ubiquitin-related modifier, SUMO [Corchorus capsularis]|uniref:Small ubiquitin-related modifier, SUMO n=1 Tax=Corchorus capsularis TaxID=210143 RepID=A0A1R3GVD0_COCAP|nr:Small ubiquitin-related modifier, SUMO [Corchorus capsularis]